MKNTHWQMTYTAPKLALLKSPGLRVVRASFWSISLQHRRHRATDEAVKVVTGVIARMSNGRLVVHMGCHEQDAE